MRAEKRNVLTLVVCQALFQTASVLIMTVGGLAGQMLAADKSLATLPIASMSVGTALATMYGVHRATAKRWLASARETLMQRTREHLQAALGVNTVELRSAMDLARSRLELSLSRVLGPGEDEPP